MRTVWRSVADAVTKYKYRFKLNKLEIIFAILFLVFGGITIAMIPPGWNTDEPDHTYRIYQLSKGDLFSQPVLSPLGNPGYGSRVSINLINFYTDAGVRDAGANALNTGQRVNNLYQMHPKLDTYADSSKEANINFSGSSLYSPFSYIIYIPVFLIGDALHVPFLTIIILSRIVGLLFVAACFFVAIRRIVFGRWILFVVGLLPITITQAATVGADALAIGFTVIFALLFVNTFFKKDSLTWKNYLLIALAGSLLALSKIGYIPLVALILVLPFIQRKRFVFFRTKPRVQSIILALAAFIVAIVPALIWTHMVSYININSNLQANFPMQESFVIHHPVTYLKTVYYTFFTNQQAPLAGLFGDAVWTSARLPLMYSYLAMVAVLLSLFVASPRDMNITKDKRTRVLRIAFIFVAVATSVFISTIIYVSSTTLQQSSISGLQARYFIPPLLFILLACFGNRIKNQTVPKVVICAIVLVLLTGSILMLYNRLYQTLPMII